MNSDSPKANDKLIPAFDAFGKGKPLQKDLPEFTIADLSEMGCTFVETEETRLLKVPFEAQRRLIEALKKWGFGAAHALDLLLNKILKMYGFCGRVQTKAEDDTFAWIAFESKKEDVAPSEPAAETKTSAPPRGGDEKLFQEELRDYFAQGALIGLLSDSSRHNSQIDGQALGTAMWQIADCALAARGTK